MRPDVDLMPAYLNHGRWVVDCPACNSGWMVRRETPSLLLDARGGARTECSCGAAIVVQFPESFEEIEALTSLRPAANRNWRPGESVFDLRIENAAHRAGG